MRRYRNLTTGEIRRLKENFCSADCWNNIKVAYGFNADYVCNVRFSGEIRLGVFEYEFVLPGGIKKHSAIRGATLHNVTLGDNCLVENVNNYIANYIIGDYAFIENVDIIFVDGVSRFGNGVEVPVLNETGGREVWMHDRLSSHQAYMMALYRHRPKLIERMKVIIENYADENASSVGRIGDHVTIVDSGYIKSVRIGDNCEIEGASRLRNGSVNSLAESPVHIGCNVICDDFIISDGSRVEDGCVLTRCFVGQCCELKQSYTASDSLFFGNSRGANGEACSLFAGPFTVTHHKSTLLIAGMFSFMNAGSGSNQSNHLYKLGPIHQGIMERGAKTTSDSYILWPAKIGAFSLVMGRHVNHPDTSSLPFSYLIEQQNSTYLVPAVNLRSVGTIRDAQKWPQRHRRRLEGRLDQINYNLLSPYTIQKMMDGINILQELQRASGETSDTYSYQSAKIKSSSLSGGISLYRMAIKKFLGNSLIKRLEGVGFASDEEIRARLKPDGVAGLGEWVDMSGLIAPKGEVERLMSQIEGGRVTTVDFIHDRFAAMHRRYYEYEWAWAYDKMLAFYGLEADKITARDVADIVRGWKEAVVGLDEMLYADARKEFSLSFMTGFGADGSHEERAIDFEQVRGLFECNTFVKIITEHVAAKEALGDELIGRLSHLL